MFFPNIPEGFPSSLLNIFSFTDFAFSVPYLSSNDLLEYNSFNFSNLLFQLKKDNWLQNSTSFVQLGVS